MDVCVCVGVCVFAFVYFSVLFQKILANWCQSQSKSCLWECMDVCVYTVGVFVCDLRVHSFRGVLKLMWMLSIQMCPLVPCTKKPSITTYRIQNKGGRKRRKRREKLKKEEEEEEDGDRMKARGVQRGWRQIENGDKQQEEEEKEKEDKNLIWCLWFQSCTQHLQSSSSPLQVSATYFFMRTLTACDVSDKCTEIPKQSWSQ